MAKSAISTEAKLALKFFTAHGRCDYKEALCIFRSTSLDPTVMQSSREKIIC